MACCIACHGAYIPVQVKGRTSLTPAGQVHITVTASSLVDDDALIVGTLVDGSDLGAFVLVVTEADFRRFAAHDEVEGREYLTAAFELRGVRLRRAFGAHDLARRSLGPGVGWGSRNRAHSPNEFMRLGDFENAARHIARLVARFASA